MKTVKRVAWSNNKKNKTRSILIMAAVFLSTVLLTTILTFANWMVRSSKANAAIDYGSHYGTFSNVDLNQLQEMKRHGEFSKIGLLANAGYLDLDGSIRMMASDETVREFSNLDKQLTDGGFPETADEIAAQTEFFETAGYKDVHVGDKIRLDYRPDLKHKFEPKEFTVSGILAPQTNESAQKRFMVLVSQAFAEEQYKNEIRYVAAFQLGEEVRITSDDAEEVIKALAAKCGIEEENVSVNGVYLMFKLETGAETFTVCAVIIAAVILFSVIIIYNIFHVSIVQNIREYGKIRALGAGKKQMRRLIFYEGLSLAACSIPPGVVIGYIVAWVSVHWMTAQEKMVGSIERRIAVNVFSLPILLLAAGLALLTVLLALRKPMKIVSKISPVEALCYTENAGNLKAGFRKGKKSMSVFNLTMANIAANKKRTAMTIFTMGLSCVLFVILANCVGNMDTEYVARGQVEYGQFQIELNYYLEDESYPENNLDAILKNNPLNQALVQKIRAIDGVTEVKSRNILLAECNGNKEDIAVLDQESFARTKKRTGFSEGDIDFQEGMEQDYFYYGWGRFLEENGYHLGQKLTAEITNGTDQVTVNGELQGTFGHADADFVITEGTYERMGFTDASIGWLWVDCRPEDVQYVQSELEQLLSGTDHVEMSVFEQELKTAEASVRVMKAGCYAILVILGLIGFMNLANTMIMNIITKKQEYGILQAVGMTNRQLNASLQLQGLLFSAGTVLVAVFAGLPIGYAVFCYGKKNAIFGLNVYHIPVLEIVMMIAAIGLLQALLSFLLSRNLKKESLVERIRYQE